MRLRHTLLLLRRIVATGASFLVVAVASRAGEPIRFSKPAVPLASPIKEQAKLPEPRAKGMEFDAPGVERPMVVPRPQQVIRIDRRDNTKEDDLPPSLRTPKSFNDPDRFNNPDDQKLPSDPSRSSNLPGKGSSQSPRTSDVFGGSRPDSSLSPITDPNWDARDSARQTKNSRNSTKGDRNDYRARNPFTAQDDSDSKFDAVRSSSVRDLFTSYIKEKPADMQVERQTAFQQLINPTAEAGGKALSSLQPVVSVKDVKPGGLGIPTIGGETALHPRSSDPMAAFNRQHERTHGPLVEDINKKYSAPPSPAAKTSTLDPRLPLPLNRQPAMHEFPKRNF